MVFTLYGHTQSTCAQRVAIILHEKQVPFKWVIVDISKGEQYLPENLAKQPFGKVPFIDDDGFILYESRAIARYIAEKYADQGTPGLIPTDLKEKALMEQAASVETFNYDVHASSANFEKLFSQYFGRQPDEAKFDALMTTLEKNLDVYEAILSKQKYIAGDKITLADLFHIPTADLLPKTGRNPFESRPNVARWIKELESRPSWQNIKDGIKSTAE